MNSGRFSDEELRKLNETVSHYVPEFERLRDNVNAHLLEGERMEVLLKIVRSDVKCLHDSMKLYQPFLEGALKGQAQMASLRKAIIEKTAIGLVWAAIVGLSVLLYHGMIEHLRFLFGGQVK